jgi:hypothetical protein
MYPLSSSDEPFRMSLRDSRGIPTLLSPWEFLRTVVSYIHLDALFLHTLNFKRVKSTFPYNIWVRVVSIDEEKPTYAIPAVCRVLGENSATEA